MKFAKLFERGNQQVLLLTEYDDEEDVTKLRIITETEGQGVRVEKSVIFSDDNQTENAQKALDNFTEEKALSLFGYLDNILK